MLEELGIDKLVPNDYNPPNRIVRRIDSLSSSLKGDGQISTITVRPINDGKYEIVDGTRRFEAARKAGLSQMLCNVLNLTREEAMDYNYIANKETEPDSPMDEAWRFFERLGLREEQLYIYVGHGDSTLHTKECSPLPSERNKEVIALADRLNIRPERIYDRLPLMALPPQLVQLLEKEEMAIGSAEQLARLRFLEDKEEAQSEMIKTWNKCGNNIGDTKVSVDATLDDYRRTKELAEQDLKPYEEQVNDRLKKLKKALLTIDLRIDEFRKLLPEEIADDYKDKFSRYLNPEIPKEIDADWEWPTNLIKFADKVSAELNQDDRIARNISSMQSRRNDLQVNRSYIKDHGECRYCGTSIQLAKFDEILTKVQEEIESLREKDEARATAAMVNNQIRKDIREAWNDYSSSKKALDKAREKKAEALKRGTRDGDNT
jgi:ParB-like chromosome segregation protein Spo0J/Asp-tRNA(Asn)/Glu-tRNA(Gln) amidotransferase C subunit